MRKETRKYLIFSATSLSLPLLFGAPAFADSSASVDVTITVPTACNLTITNDDLSTTINPGGTGTIGTATIKSLCNDASGLAVYAVGYTDDTYGNNYLTTELGDSHKIHSNVSSGTPSASEWYMTLAPVSGTYAPTIMNQTTGQNPVGNFTQAHAVPTVYTKVAYRNTGTDIGNNADGSSFTATFGAYVAPNQPASTYSGTVKFLLVHPNVLTYNDQTGEPATYQPDTLAQDPEVTIGGCLPSSPILQEVATWGNSVTLGDTIDVIDARDRQCYKVSRFKMNSAGTETALWMSNLNLGAEELLVSKLDSTNTHLPSDGSKDIDASDFMDWDRTVSGVSNSYTDPKFTPLTTSNSSNGLAEDTYENKYGTLYNYTATSANTINAISGANYDNASYDLCPSGWRLPTGRTTGELYQLITTSYGITSDATGSTSLQQDLGFPRAGYFGNSTPTNQGSDGSYWSSTLSGGAGMYILYFSSSGVFTTASSNRSNGISVRCIAQ